MKKRYTFIKLFSFASLLLFTISSCKKNNSIANSSPYFISFSTNDGSSVITYRNQANATIGSISQLSAYDSTGATGIVMVLNGGPIISTQVTYNDTSYNNVFSQIDEVNINGSVLGSSEALDSPMLRLNFDTTNNSFVKGTFSGYIQMQSSGAVTKISRGLFYLPIKK